ncbi:RNA polymerase sigma factor [uncultured Algibacter sp.]|uniref:RNA polymerase sigma factor n=1 Tax=uncultured Algibacter sp. TaxID=298659 RepID=UPI002614EF92|nr:RNA polymerase sigma factor [uncultured Algibacter sp.]
MELLGEFMAVYTNKNWVKTEKAIDGKLVQQFQSGNKNALALLVKRWHKTFCEKAYWIVKDADVAKDIAQDSWSIIIIKISHLKTPESFGSWALRIVYTKSLDWIKENNKLKNNIDNKHQLQHVFDEARDSSESIKAILLKTIKTLPENQQMVIRLFYMQEYSLKEISTILNISEGTVKSRLFHAREKLKQILKTYNL